MRRKSIICATVAMAALAVGIPAAEAADPPPIVITVPRLTNELYVANYQLEMADKGQLRYDRDVEKRLLVAAWDNSNGSMTKDQVVALGLQIRGAMAQARQSPMQEFTSSMDAKLGWTKILVDALPGAPALGKAYVSVVEQSLKQLSDLGAKDGQAISLNDMETNRARIGDDEPKILLGVRARATVDGGRAFGLAIDALDGGDSQASVFDDADKILDKNADLRGLHGLRNFIDEKTGDLKTVVEKGVDVVRADIKALRTEAEDEFKLINDQNAVLQTTLTDIATAQAADHRTLTDYIADEAGRRAQQAKAEAAAKLRESQIGAAQGAVYLISRFASIEDPRLGKEIATVGNSAIQIGDALTKFTSLVGSLGNAFNPIAAFSAVSTASTLVNVVSQLADMWLGVPQTPTPEQMIIDQIAAMRTQLANLGKDMNKRFDRIDAGLNQLFASVNSGFSRLTVALEMNSQAVHRLVAQMADVQLSVNDLQRNLHEVVADQARRPLWHVVGDLHWAEHFPDAGPMPKQKFLQDNTFLFSWSTQDSYDSVATGPSHRAFEDHRVLTELNAYPLETNIDYLFDYAAGPLGLDLGVSRLPNPRDWALGARAYAELMLEWPQYAKQVDPGRFGALAAEGESLHDAVQSLRASGALFPTLLDRYRAAGQRLRRALVAVEDKYASDKWTIKETDPIWSGSLFDVQNEDVPALSSHVPACEEGGPRAVAGAPKATLPSALAVDMILQQAKDSLPSGTTLPAPAAVCWMARGSEFSPVTVTVKTTYDGRVARTLRYATGMRLACHWEIEIGPDGKPSRVRVCENPTDVVTDGDVAQALASTPADDEGVIGDAKAALPAALQPLRETLADEARKSLENGEPHDAAQALGGMKALIERFMALGYAQSLQSDELVAMLLKGPVVPDAGPDEAHKDPVLEEGALPDENVIRWLEAQGRSLSSGQAAVDPVDQLVEQLSRRSGLLESRITELRQRTNAAQERQPLIDSTLDMLDLSKRMVAWRHVLKASVPTTDWHTAASSGMSIRLTLDAPGQTDLLLEGPVDHGRRAAIGRRKVTSTAARTQSVTLRPTAAGAALLARPEVRRHLRLTARFSPSAAGADAVVRHAVRLSD